MSEQYKCRKIDCPGADLFSCLSVADQAKLSHERIARRYEASRTIIHCDTPAVALLVVHSGGVRLTRTIGSGQVVVGERGRGALLGLHEVLTGMPHRSTIETIKPSIICAAPRDVFLEVVQNCPELALRLLRLLAKDHLLVEEQLVARVFLSVSARTARLLIALQDDQNAQGNDGWLRLNREEMALLVGATRETLSRTLSALCVKGYLELRNGSVRLRDPDALESIGQGLPALLDLRAHAQVGTHARAKRNGL